MAKKSSLFKKVSNKWPLFHKKFVPLRRIYAFLLSANRHDYLKTTLQHEE
jgi:hypothetical protein